MEVFAAKAENSLLKIGCFPAQLFFFAVASLNLGLSGVVYHRILIPEVVAVT